jgi:hypothetical protein
MSGNGLTLGQMQRFQPIPLIQPSGVQPYQQAGGQMPGPALTAMQAGRTLFGVNPQDVVRQSQSMAKRRPRSILG